MLLGTLFDPAPRQREQSLIAGEQEVLRPSGQGGSEELACSPSRLEVLALQFLVSSHGLAIDDCSRPLHRGYRIAGRLYWSISRFLPKSSITFGLYIGQYTEEPRGRHRRLPLQSSDLEITAEYLLG